MKATRFLEPAQTELEEHVSYFDGQASGLGDRFEQEVRRAVARILEHPKIGEALTKRIRKLRLLTFPYNLVYVDDIDELVIVAIAAHSRRPNYWRARLGSVR